jgi:hypothetical protein
MVSSGSGGIRALNFENNNQVPEFGTDSAEPVN